MDFRLRKDLPEQRKDPQVGDDKGVHAAAPGPTEEIPHSVDLPIPGEGVAGQVDLAPGRVGQLHRLRKLPFPEAGGGGPHPELRGTQINGIRAVPKSGPQPVQVPGRSQDLRTSL